MIELAKACSYIIDSGHFFSKTYTHMAMSIIRFLQSDSLQNLRLYSSWGLPNTIETPTLGYDSRLEILILIFGGNSEGKMLPNPIVIPYRNPIPNTRFLVRPFAGGVWSSYLVVSKRTWVLSNHQIWRLYSQYKRIYPHIYFLSYNGFILCKECIHVFLVYFFKNEDRFLQHGLTAEYRCFSGVSHSPGGRHSQILNRFGHREAYHRHG